MSFSSLRTIISTECVFDEDTRSNKMGREQHRVVALYLWCPECVVMVV